jgi:cytosine/uracil/thiamine/allantoin permease
MDLPAFFHWRLESCEAAKTTEEPMDISHPSPSLYNEDLAPAKVVGLVVKAGGFSFDHGIPQDVLIAKTKDAGISGEPGSFWALCAVGATWVTYFAALYLNFCDFSRYAPDKATVRRGNL